MRESWPRKKSRLSNADLRAAGATAQVREHALLPRWSGGDKAARTRGTGAEKRFYPQIHR
jgi:hypothetical protein